MMISKKIALSCSLAVAMLLFLQAGPSAAHHSGAMFDRSKTLTLTGVVKEFQYTNPHSWLIVDVPQKDGSTKTWGFESEGPSTLMRAGIRKSSLMPGTKVTITTHPMRDGTSAGTWIKVVTSDGKVYVPRPKRGR